ncbi:MULTISPECIES: DUF6466 family protein [Bifidobacterium]|uniref:DUF6466 family protein n=1 Tax=Bifidobacterium TaxID=1678 RepID=UPI001BDC2FF5|nr:MULTISPECIES: DUF6466 family protein [Bifidobacterium]MBT1161063.1 cell surface protein [Bifidobacterium sp. SO1]MBW3078139.1 cell surface protein [Bifidobacterium simiiventris]
MSDTTSARKARAGLAVRVALGVAAAVFVVFGVLAAVNLRAVDTFNRATDDLTEHIAAVNAETPDYNALSTLQDQTDAQFRDAAAAGAVLLPSIRDAIARNADVSAKLTQLVRQRLSEQTDQQNGQTAEGQSGTNDQTQDDSGSAQSGLTDEQRRQVEELLQSNGQNAPADGSSADGSQSETTNNTGNSSKPW